MMKSTGIAGRCWFTGKLELGMERSGSSRRGCTCQPLCGIQVLQASQSMRL